MGGSAVDGGRKHPSWLRGTGPGIRLLRPPREMWRTPLSPRNQTFKRALQGPDSATGPSATIYRATLIARVGKFPLLVLPPLAKSLFVGEPSHEPPRDRTLDNDA